MEAWRAHSMQRASATLQSLYNTGKLLEPIRAHMQHHMRKCCHRHVTRPIVQGIHLLATLPGCSHTALLATYITACHSKLGIITVTSLTAPCRRLGLQPLQAVPLLQYNPPQIFTWSTGITTTNWQ
eukprot:346377-Pelagomonas_calceolata.AAC.2